MMRADVYLTEKGYVQSRQRARVLIDRGCVTVDGRLVTKPALPISDDSEHTVEIRDDIRFVGRGGLKLEGALEAFGISVEGCSALDVGASTGGFTDCLLSRGAASVCAVDAGEGQLAEKLLRDGRVRSIERKNARELTLEEIGGACVDLIVMDVSFISATYILPRFPLLMKKGGQAVVLIKPQFEVGKSKLGKGGIVKDPRAHREAVERVLSAAVGVGLTPIGLIASPVTGGDGNREFLLHLTSADGAPSTVTEDEVRRVTGARTPI